MRLLCIGECMIEMAPTADGNFSMGFAGDTFNTAWYARRLAADGLRVGYFSAIGDDEPSARMRNFIQGAGIEAELVERPGGSVGLYMISLKDGERSFSYWRSAAAARTLADDLDTLPVAKGDIAYFSGITMAILPDTGKERLLAAMQKAAAAGATVAFDPNLRPRLWADTQTMCHWIMRAAEVSQIALPSFEDEQSFFDDADAEATAARYVNAGADLTIVKNGAGPILIRSHDGDETLTPEPATDVVDTTAAGDSFNAGVLVALAEGASARDATARGSALARKVIAARGALVEV